MLNFKALKHFLLLLTPDKPVPALIIVIELFLHPRRRGNFKITMATMLQTSNSKSEGRKDTQLHFLLFNMKNLPISYIYTVETSFYKNQIKNGWSTPVLENFFFENLSLSLWLYMSQLCSEVTSTHGISHLFWYAETTHYSACARCNSGLKLLL